MARRLAILLCGVVLSSPPLVAQQSLARASLVDGKTLTEWVAALKNDDVEVRYGAVKAVAAFLKSDAAVLPPLLAAVCDRDLSVRRAAWTAVAASDSTDPRVNQAWLEALRDPNEKVRIDACAHAAALEKIDIIIRIDALVGRLDDDPVLRMPAAKALTHLDPLGDRTVPVIVDHLGTGAMKELQLIELLPAFGERGRKALRSFAASADAEITQKIAASLDAKWPDATDLARTLIKSDDPSTRATAMQRTLHFPKEQIQSFARDFVHALGDENDEVSHAGYLCVRYIDPSPAVLRGLIDLLKGPTPGIRSRAAQALIRLDKYPQAVTKALIDAALIDRLEEPLRVIHQLGPDPRVLPALLQRVKSDDAPSDALLSAVVRLGRDRDEVAETMADRLRSEKRDGGQASAAVRLQILSAIWWMGPGAREALPDLMDEASDPNPAIRRAAVAALGHIGAEAKAAIPLLEMRLRDENREVAEEARSALVWIR